MIRYGCEFSPSLDEACNRLDKEGLPYKVLQECVLGFRKKPCRRAKIILTRCGFERQK